MKTIQYDWKEIQKYYDDNHTWNDIHKKYGISLVRINKASKHGDFKSRSKSEGRKLSYELHPEQTHNLSGRTKYNWKEIQKYYDDNHTWRDIIDEFGITMAGIHKATKSGRFISRTLSDAVKLSCKLKPRKHTDRTSIGAYRCDCNFKFNVFDYPNEFNIDLLNEHGFYSPSNKNNNLDGVSRDHMISVRYGYDNNIDPKILSHPANCKLLLHNKENTTKGISCSITLDELNKRIHDWDIKYK